MPAVILSATSQGGTCYCIDFSKFDSSVCSFLVHTAWTILAELMHFPTKLDRLVFDFCYSLFMNTPLVMPDGRLYVVSSGVTSGSYFTQIIDSIVNMIVIYMFMHSTSRTFYPLKVLGDNSLFVTPQPLCEPDDIPRYFAKLGLTISDKTVITNNFSDTVFLGHNFYGARVTRDEFTCLSLALHTENTILTAQASALRIASLIHDSGFNCFGLLNLYKRLLATHDIDWNLEQQRPADSTHPYFQLFMLG